MSNRSGMNWIRQEKRLAIYLRDGLSCVYCGLSVEDGEILTLDHLKPRSKGGSNEVSNLVTACKLCNDVRKDRPVKRFATDVAQYLNGGLKVQDILDHIKSCVKRPIDVEQAKRLISIRGSAARVVASSANVITCIE